MRFWCRKAVVVTVLITLVIAFGRDSLDQSWLRHELEHAREGVVASDSQDRTNLARSGIAHDGDPAGAIDETEHELLHAAVQLQVPMLVGSVLPGVVEPLPAVLALPPGLLSLPTAGLEPPFRPPRISAVSV